MLALALAGVIFSLVLTSLILVTYARWHYGSLEKIGIPVVKPHWLLGSFHDFQEKVNHLEDYALYKKYGEVFGVYEGRTPKIYCCDPDIVRQVFIKQSDKFPNRGLADTVDFGDLGKEFVDNLEGEAWKVVRSALSPVFTTSKLKKMSHHMIETAQDYVGLLRQECNKTENGVLQNHNLYQEFWLMLIDMAARCTLNVKVQDPRNPQNDFAKALAAAFEPSNFQMHAWLNKYRFAFPFLYKLRREQGSEDSFKFFIRIFKAVIKQRKESGEKGDDFMGVVTDLMDSVNTEEFKRLSITEKTVLVNAVEFYVAGQDSMSTAFTMMVYYMKKNPEIEKKVYEEVDAYFQRHNGQVSYETLNELNYLNACLQEALRLHPIFTRIDRKCAEDTEVNGLKITKGIAVVVPMWPYQRNPKYFPDPETYDPERFMPHNKDKLDSMALATFGWGHRMCIGKRFALEGLTIATLYFLKNFKFTLTPDSKITYFPGLDVFGFMAPIPFNIHMRS